MFAAARANPATLDKNATTATETAQVFTDLDAAMQRAGLSFGDILRTRLFYTERADYAQMNEVRDPYFRRRFAKGDFPASSGCVTGGSGARPHFEIEIVAHPGKQAYNADGVIQEWAGLRPPFTHANVAGGVLFASGQSPYHLDGGIAASEPVPQTAVVLEALNKVLEAGGRSRKDAICVIAYLTPTAALQKDAIVAEIRNFFGRKDKGAHPILTIVPVAQLFKPGMEIAMELFAAASAAAPLPVGFAGSAQAVRHESFLIANSEEPGDGKSTDAFDDAFANLVAACNAVGARPSDIGLLTLWFNSHEARHALEAHARKVVGPDVALTVAPLHDDGPAILLEALGHVQADE